MLFDFGGNVFESKKERNFYAKYLGGYYFNELVPGWEHRLQAFTSLLSALAAPNNPLHTHPVTMAPGSTHATFDCHTSQLGIDLDRGEFADIFLHDHVQQILIGIEAKFLTDWSVDGDIIPNWKRLEKIKANLPHSNVISCLLIKRSKLEEARAYRDRPHSQYLRWQNEFSSRVVLLTWEDLLSVTNHSDYVREWLDNALNIPANEWGYGFDNEQIIRG